MGSQNPRMSSKPAWQRVVAEIRSASTSKGRERLRACSLEGTRLHERALRAGAAIERAVVTAEFRADASTRVRELLGELEETGTELHVVPSEVMHELTEGRSIGAIVGLATLPSEPSLDECLTERGLFLGCVGVDDPGNLGALARTAHASGAAALLCVGACDPFHPKALRTSMGSLFRLPVIQRAELAPLLVELREHGVRTAAAVSDGGTALAQAELGSAATCVFVGSEAFGLSAGESAGMDTPVTIPMADGVDSFSVNAAAAVLLWEARRAAGPRSISSAPNG
jgi:RNA methyltransferase, TrmH family